MIAQYFVDADVFIYTLDPTEPLKQEVARALVGRLWSQQCACTSVQAINEFYSVMVRRFPHVVSEAEAWATAEELLLWNPLPLDARVMRQAHSIEARYKLSWWDSLIVASARLQNCSVLYSEDLQHGAVMDGVKVVNPFTAQVQEEPASYRLPLTSPHRPRGRPRKQVA